MSDYRCEACGFPCDATMICMGCVSNWQHFYGQLTKQEYLSMRLTEGLFGGPIKETQDGERRDAKIAGQSTDEDVSEEQGGSQ